MKLGVAIYHQNALALYPQEWIDKCIDSIYNQTYKHFTTYELGYGNNDIPFTTGKYHQICLSNYAEAMNHVYYWALSDGCDIIANVNIDDYYAPNRFELLLESLNNGADIASSNYSCFDESGIVRTTSFHNLDIKHELSNNNNIVSNPCHMMKRIVFDNLRFNSTLVPVEDLAYWKICIEHGFKIEIREEVLHYYRLHKNQSGNI